MAVYTYKTILKKAKSCRTNVKKEYKNGISTKWSYYICKSIITPNKDIKKISIGDAPSPTGEKVNKTVKKQDYMKSIKNYVAYIEKNKRLPNYVTVVGVKIKPHLFTAFVSFILAKGIPATQGLKSSIYTKPVDTCSNPYTSRPHYTSEGCNKLGQCTPYFCGPHSIHQALRKFGITNISESTLAGWAATTTSGTDHQGLNTAIAMASKKSGVKLSVEWKNFSDFGKTTGERFKAIGKLICQKNKAAFFHIGYQCSGQCTSGTVFGHYEMLDKINTSTGYVRALNSLGSKCGSNSYCGHLQDRKFSVQAHFISNISQKSVCIITKG